MSLDTQEDYQLEVKTAGGVTTATINANTFFGARHALETLTQLIEYQVIHSCCFMVGICADFSEALNLTSYDLKVAIFFTFP
ncbi:putative beta-hexosaminidase fdl [Portunus trituberculatus]|uniref:Putative beta-hexosaminidase fdl n=1 Tax=Portunus trituberculatus TaxID=210409 RepID=A0A5B7ISZ7_PORTR|nr:putative beta-hexosaminidase fdl [Portunus trituberculatus]